MDSNSCSTESMEGKPARLPFVVSTALCGADSLSSHNTCPNSYQCSYFVVVAVLYRRHHSASAAVVVVVVDTAKVLPNDSLF